MEQFLTWENCSRGRRRQVSLFCFSFGMTKVQEVFSEKKE